MTIKIAKVSDEVKPWQNIEAEVQRLVVRSREIATQQGVQVAPRTRVVIVAETEFEDGQHA